MKTKEAVLMTSVKVLFQHSFGRDCGNLRISVKKLVCLSRLDSDTSECKSHCYRYNALFIILSGILELFTNVHKNPWRFRL
jgi:hypothetical protein